MLSLSGEFSDVLRSPKGVESRGPRPNMVMARALDLIAGLLGRREGMRGLVYLAVGSGDPAWDAAATPGPDAHARTLVKEVYRKRLEPADLAYDPAAHVLSVHTTFGPTEATADLRELGLFGGDASGMTDSGYLFNTARHTVIHKAEGQSLDRALKITLAGDSVLAGLLDTVGQLLADQHGATGILQVAFGSGDPAWDQHPPGFDPQRKALQNELIRKPVGSVDDIEIVPYQQALVVHAMLDYSEADVTLREVGLLGGTVDSPVLMDYAVFAAFDHSVAAQLHFDVRLEIGVDASIAVPDVTKRSLADASTALAAVGMHPGIVQEEEHPDGNNTILRQVPPAGGKAVDGASVALTISVPVSIATPRLIGLTVAAATPIASALGVSIAPGIQQMESPQPAATIISQTPAAGDLIRPGNAVSVIVATPETTLVPALTGMRTAEAAVALRNSRLAIAAPPLPTVQTKDGWGGIVEQKPAPGTRVVVGSTVTPSLAAPPEIAVPNLVGAMLASASQTLRDAAAPVLKTGGMPSEPPGLAVGQTTYVENAAAPSTILDQAPAAGQTSILFGTVDITVASPVTVMVPALLGMTEQSAGTALHNVGLLPGAVTRRADPSAPGTVLDQDPPAGSRIALGSLVRYTEASPIQVEVPALLGRTVDFANEALTGARLTLGTVTRVLTTAAPPGTITAQSQAAGKSVDVQSAVNVTIAGNTTPVPNLVSLTPAAAAQALTPIGLNMTVGSPVETAQVTAGLIGSHTPSAGVIAQVGSTVTVSLAIPPKVAVPNLVGKTLQDAQTAVAAAKFILSVSGQAESDQPPGTVAAQSPATGQLAAPGSAISVQTAVPRSIAVPALVGLSLSDARTRATGLNIVVSSQTIGNRPANTVLDQNPAAGVKVAPNSNVSVVISTGIGIQVPSVLGWAVAAARTELQKRGFVVWAYDAPSVQAVGTVINQNPAGGATALQGSTVSLTVSIGRRRPDIIDRPPILNPNIVR